MIGLYQKLLECKSSKVDSAAREIAKYFLDSDIEIIKTQGIEEVAKKCYTTKSSVSRFVKSLDIDDFKYFKHRIIEERSILKTMHKSDGNLVNKKDGVFLEYCEVMKQEVDYIKGYQANIEKLTNQLITQSRIVLFSSHQIYNELQEFASLLQMKLKNLVYIQNSMLKMLYLEDKKESDVIIFIINNEDDYAKHENALLDLEAFKENKHIFCSKFLYNKFQDYQNVIIYDFAESTEGIFKDNIMVKFIFSIIERMIV